MCKYKEWKVENKREKGGTTEDKPSHPIQGDLFEEKDQEGPVPEQGGRRASPATTRTRSTNLNKARTTKGQEQMFRGIVAVLRAPRDAAAEQRASGALIIYNDSAPASAEEAACLRE